MLGVHSRVGRMGKLIISETLILVVLLGLTASRAMAVDDPQSVVKTGTDQVLQLLRDFPGNAQVRREKIRNVVDRYFDFTEMAKRALGPRWKTVPPEKQQEFTRDFSQLIFNVYIRKVEKYTNEKIGYRHRTTEGDLAVVDSVVVGDQTGRIVIDYYLTRKSGTWKVYDVAIEGVDLTMNYRSQFNSILSASSFDDLLAQLKKKNSQN